MTRPIHTPKPWAANKPRSMGGPFDVLYQERAPERAPRIRTNPKRTYTDKVLRDLENTAPAFNVAIGTQKDSDRNQAIKGRA